MDDSTSSDAPFAALHALDLASSPAAPELTTDIVPSIEIIPPTQLTPSTPPAYTAKSSLAIPSAYFSSPTLPTAPPPTPTTTSLIPGGPRGAPLFTLRPPHWRLLIVSHCCLASAPPGTEATLSDDLNFFVSPDAPMRELMDCFDDLRRDGRGSSRVWVVGERRVGREDTVLTLGLKDGEEIHVCEGLGDGEEWRNRRATSVP